jgi:hypothetical protein
VTLRPWWTTLVVSAVLALATPASAGTHNALTTINVRAEILSNCHLEVQSDVPQSGVSVNLRCAQETVARIEVEPNGPRPTGRHSALAMAQRGAADSADGGWVARETFVTGNDDSWMMTADHKTPKADELTVHVDF